MLMNVLCMATEQRVNRYPWLHWGGCVDCQCCEKISGDEEVFSHQDDGRNVSAILQGWPPVERVPEHSWRGYITPGLVPSPQHQYQLHADLSVV
jgi:hypothetical protein